MQPLAGMTDMAARTVDMSDLHWRLIEAQAEGKYCSGCAFDGILVAGRAGADPTLVTGESREDWLDEFEGSSRWRTRPGSRRMGSARSAAGPGPAPCASGGLSP